MELDIVCPSGLGLHRHNTEVKLMTVRKITTTQNPSTQMGILLTLSILTSSIPKVKAFL